MKNWPLDDFCASQYGDPGDRRFHAQPVACSSCGPNYYLQGTKDIVRGNEGLRRAAELIRTGKILAVKGLGG
jgi:hydrogenase maturation protein HypF